MKNLSKIVLITALGVAATANAATDGTLGATSTGTSDVTLIKDNAVLITGVDDLDLGTLNSTAVDLVASDDLCVFNSTTNYRVTMTSANGSFVLEDALGANAIPYGVTWADASATANTVSYGTAMINQLGDRTSTSCSGGTNASFAVSVTAADFNTAAPGNYSDTLTMMIEPE